MKTDSMLPFEEEPAVSDQETKLPEGKKSFTPEELYRFTRIKPFVLRFWESEFPALKPKKDDAGGMAYCRADVEMVLAIKSLLYDDGLTLAEARRRLSGEEQPFAEAPAGAKAGRRTASARKPPRTSKSSGGSGKGGGGAGKSAKQSAAPPAKAGEKKRPGGSRSTAKKAAAGEKGKGRRGLPDDGGQRSRVSLEELLPDSMNRPEGRGGEKEEGREAGPGAKAAAAGPDELRQALAGAVRELRGILTLLRKGDR